MATEDTYRRAAAASGIALFEWNLVTGDTFVDPVLKERLGYEDHAFGDDFQDWSSLTHPDDVAPALARVESHIKGETPFYQAEYRMRHRDGTYRWFQSRGSVSRNEHGIPTWLTGTTTDITDRKRSEEALRRREIFRAGQHRVLEMI